MSRHRQAHRIIEFANRTGTQFEMTCNPEDIYISSNATYINDYDRLASTQQAYKEPTPCRGSFIKNLKKEP